MREGKHRDRLDARDRHRTYTEPRVGRVGWLLFVSPAQLVQAWQGRDNNNCSINTKHIFTCQYACTSKL